MVKIDGEKCEKYSFDPTAENTWETHTSRKRNKKKSFQYFYWLHIHEFIINFFLKLKFYYYTVALVIQKKVLYDQDVASGAASFGNGIWEN